MSTSASPGLVKELQGPIAVLRFNRPSSRNSLSQSVIDELERALDEVIESNDVDAIIFTGTGNVFASGADIGEVSNLTPHAAEQFSRRGQNLFQRIADARQLTIAAINGFCMGGAIDLALACDLRIASREAVFAHPGARLGIITGWGGTQRLPRLIGRTRALEFFITAKHIDSAEALQSGLVSELADPVLDRALALAHQIKQERRDPHAAL
jgi:enoyl-CoA hydratase